jgi:hypothetical protein
MRTAGFFVRLNKLPTALPVIDPRDWQGKTVPERRWFVEGLMANQRASLRLVRG